MMKLSYKYILIFLVILINSCKNNQKKEQNSKQIKKEFKSEIPKENIYTITDKLLKKQFKNKIKYIDFKLNSKIKPYHFELYNKLGLINIRGYLNPTYNKSYVSKNFENYLLFIFEYRDITFAEKSFITYKKDNKRILELIKNDEWFNPNKKAKNDINTSRALKMSALCKSGGMVFHKNNYTINIVKTCRKPLTIKKMKWKEYENMFLKAYLNVDKTLILNANCGARNYEYEYYTHQ